MSNVPSLRSSRGPEPEARFLALRPASAAAPASFCKGDTVDEVRRTLERIQAPGRYRVFDRCPPARGIDFELVGVFVVIEGGVVRWKPLRPA